ncbi:MAG: molybdopterin-dependent oxidoreductase [Bacteroidetes bacterium]|nr:molybdopterin-dependent oxidoreductase [Bacteroidota bacterium]
MSDKKIISRKEFLKLTGLSLGGLALTSSAGYGQVVALSEKVLTKLSAGQGTVTWRNTVCRLCPSACGLSVKRINGVPISLKGNTSSPINRGGVCPAAHANLELLYHPDRFTEPMARPEGQLRKDLVPVSWEEIGTSTANTINELVQNNQGHRIAIINGDDTPIMQESWQNFAHAIGTPNIYQMDYSGLSDNATFLTQGFHEKPLLDLINSECIISFGSNFLEEDGAAVHFNQVYRHFKDLENITRNKLIYVGPRANITAASAHRWIPIEPDTWGTLALGIIHVLVSEDAVNLDFIRKYSKYYFDWKDEDGVNHIGLETQIRSDFHPKKVEEITGIPEEDIFYLAELIRTRENCIVITGSEALRTPRGDLHQWAVHCLNFIMGNFQQKGGLYYRNQDNNTKLDTVTYQGDTAKNLFKSDENNPLEKPSLDIFAKRVEGYSPYNIDLLIINKSNPVYWGENRAKWKATLKHIKRVIFIGDMPNETSKYADVILPCNSELESWDLAENVPSAPFDSATLQRPVIDPIYNTKESYNILSELVERSVGREKYKSFDIEAKKLVQNRLKSIYNNGKGSLFKDLSSEEWAHEYQHHKSPVIKESQKSFMKQLLKVGGWWETALTTELSLNDVLKTKSGKFEFLSTTLNDHFKKQNNSAHLLNDLLAKKEYSNELIRFNTSGDDDFPIVLLSGFPITNPNGNTVASPTLLESFGILREIYWEAWAEINPETAKKYSVEDGTIIQIDSQVGAIRVRARVRPIIHPNAIFIPLGLGREAGGRFGSNIGSDPRNLMIPQPNINTGNIIVSGSPIRITKV